MSNFRRNSGVRYQAWVRLLSSLGFSATNLALRLYSKSTQPIPFVMQPVIWSIHQFWGVMCSIFLYHLRFFKNYPFLSGLLLPLWSELAFNVHSLWYQEMHNAPYNLPSHHWWGSLEPKKNAPLTVALLHTQMKMVNQTTALINKATWEFQSIYFNHIYMVVVLRSSCIEFFRALAVKSKFCSKFPLAESRHSEIQ